MFTRAFSAGECVMLLSNKWVSLAIIYQPSVSLKCPTRHCLKWGVKQDVCPSSPCQARAIHNLDSARLLQLLSGPTLRTSVSTIYWILRTQPRKHRPTNSRKWWQRSSCTCFRRVTRLSPEVLKSFQTCADLHLVIDYTCTNKIEGNCLWFWFLQVSMWHFKLWIDI